MAPDRLRPTVLSALGIAGWVVLALAPAAKAQIGFAANVGSFPNGVILNVTPVVSADRRYVRMTLNPVFNSLEGFDSYSVPFAVSGGGGGGGGGLGGLGGGGLGGNGGGGFRNVTIAAGMDGVVAPGSPFGQGGAIHSAYASEDASAMLSGSAGYAFSPILANDPTPAPRRVSKKLTRKSSPKQAGTAKRR